MSGKRYLDAQELLEDSWRLGAQVLASGFAPDFIVAIWRGGAPIGIAVQEYLESQGVQANHIAIRAASYTGIDGRSNQVQLYSMNYLIKHARQEDAMLIVDDVFDTGRSIAAVIDHLTAKARRNTPADIRVAVPFYKPLRNLTERVPDYFIHETDEWLKFPHSLEGLTDDEIVRHRPRLAAILDSAKSPGTGASK